MHSSIGKPLVALVSAACLAAPALTPIPDHPVITQSTIPIKLSASVTPFDPLPSAARALGTYVAATDNAKIVDAVDTMAELSGVDTATLLLQLLTAPYHNFVGVSIALGKAVNAFVQLVSLPFSVATYVLTNRTTEVPAYIQTVRTNLGNALPGIADSVKSEIQYDVDLLTRLFGGSTTTTSDTATTGADVTAAATTDPGTVLLQLATIPYHNFVGISVGVGKAVNAVVQLVSLPFSVATYVLTNRTTEIPAYVDTVRANLKGAIPGIVNSVTSEIAYDRSIFQQVFGPGSEVMATNAEQAPNLLAGDAGGAVVESTPDEVVAKVDSPKKGADEDADDQDTATEHVKESTSTPDTEDTEDTGDTGDTGDESSMHGAPEADVGSNTKDASTDASTDTSTGSPDRKSTDKPAESTGGKAGATTAGKHRKHDTAADAA